MERKTVVIALGGNALGKDAYEQKEAVANTAKVIVDLAEQGLDIVVVVRTTAKDRTYKEIESALLHLGKIHKILKEMI